MLKSMFRLKLCGMKHLLLFSTKVIEPIQEAALNESCIVVDECDTALGHASKRDCHRVNADSNLILHRAFSVFLFNSKNEILLQKRASSKVTFPGCVTNACCSHPLYDLEGEREERDALGVRRAAQRRLQQELGVPPHETEPSDFHYLTRIHYKSLGDGTWGEHELDYILFLQKDVTLDPNPHEVSDLFYVRQPQWNEFLSQLKSPLTPWFDLVARNKLQLWWTNLGQLDKYTDLTTIHSF